MRTARLVEPRRFEVVETDVPRPGAGEVLVRVRGCGVCASNLGPWGGIRGIEYPMDAGAPGHEVFGTVEEVGPEVAEGPPRGAAVTALSFHGFAEYDVARAEDTVVLPPGLESAPVLGEPVACAVNVRRRAGIREGDTVVVLGIGFLGALLVRLVRGDGPARVVAVSRRDEGLEMARRMGADEVLRYEDDVVARVEALTGGRLADVVIEATGRPMPLELAAKLTRVRGRLVIAGYHQDGPRSVNLQLWNWRGLDVVNAHERDPAIYTQGMIEGVRLLETGALDLRPLVSHVVSLDEIGRAFSLAEERPAGFFKAVVLPGGAP
ncbi:MAG TPA: zinc-binding dehydrogenase [Longimicrobiales bacterium]